MWQGNSVSVTRAISNMSHHARKVACQIVPQLFTTTQCHTKRPHTKKKTFHTKVAVNSSQHEEPKVSMWTAQGLSKAFTFNGSTNNAGTPEQHLNCQRHRRADRNDEQLHGTYWRIAWLGYFLQPTTLVMTYVTFLQGKKKMLTQANMKHQGKQSMQHEHFARAQSFC